MSAAAVLPAAAAAQPVLLAVPTPPANQRGWTNSPAKVEYVCGRAIDCPDDVVVEREGAAQLIESTARGAANTTATAAVTLNIDWTAPVVTIQSPARATTTTGASIAVVAAAHDALSGARSTTCNGRPAAIDTGGVIRCEVPLVVGANDVVVEVSDHADNSGSAGFRIVRTGAPRLTIVPEVVGMIVGQVTTLQVLDAADLPARGVAWHLDNPSAAEVSSDGRHVFTARTPGTVTITATAGGVTAKAIIMVYAGDRLPMGATSWQIGSLTTVMTPDTQPQKPTTRTAVSAKQNPGGPTWIESINESTGWLNWRERPGAHVSEEAATIRELVDRSAVVLVHSNEHGRSALIRSARAPWRYQSAGRIRPEILAFPDGAVLAMEYPPHGFGRLLIFDGATGRLAMKQSLPNGVHAAFNIGCVKGAHAARHLPAQVGPMTADTKLGIQFGVVIATDTEDFAVCGQVSGTFKRTVMVATVGDGPPKVQTAATIEVSASSTAPVIEVFEVTIDRRGAKLLPWARVTEAGARESHMTRLTDNGTEEFTLPATGKIWLSGRHDDLAVTTDGTQLIGFNVVTGKVVVSAKYDKEVRIMRVDEGHVVFVLGDNHLSATDLPVQPQH